MTARRKPAQQVSAEKPTPTRRSNTADKKPVRARGGRYFPEEAQNKRFIRTGCTLLDCVLGGGWVLGRVANIVGDRSTGKTLLAIEACANFAKQYPDGMIYYREAESAFDVPYAIRLGLPLTRMDFGPRGVDTRWRTIEEVFEDLRKIVKAHTKSGAPGLYIIDSLDALSSMEALKRDVGEGSYNLEKQKILSQLFEQLISEFKEANLCIIIVSQVRDRIGFTVGDKTRRSGGKSLDFYASHIVWLSHIATIVATRHGEKRAVGVRIVANCKKNKVGEPFRKCQFPLKFSYGIDDEEASVEWLVEKKMHDRLGIVIKKKEKEEKDDDNKEVRGKKGKQQQKDDKERKRSAANEAIGAFLDDLADLPKPEFKKRAAEIRAVTIKAWEEVEGWFAPQRHKYD